MDSGASVEPILSQFKELGFWLSTSSAITTQKSLHSGSLPFSPLSPLHIASAALILSLLTYAADKWLMVTTISWVPSFLAVFYIKTS